MAQLMASGVLDRLPELRFYFAEANASWLPSTMFFLDDNHEIFSSAFGGRRMELTPSEYIARHFHFSIIRDPLAIQLADLIPTDNLMWGTDFPHSVGSFPNSHAFLDKAFDGEAGTAAQGDPGEPGQVLRPRPRRRDHADARKPEVDGRGAGGRPPARAPWLPATPSPGCSRHQRGEYRILVLENA